MDKSLAQPLPRDRPKMTKTAVSTFSAKLLPSWTLIKAVAKKMVDKLIKKYKSPKLKRLIGQVRSLISGTTVQLSKVNVTISKMALWMSKLNLGRILDKISKTKVLTIKWARGLNIKCKKLIKLAKFLKPKNIDYPKESLPGLSNQSLIIGYLVIKKLKSLFYSNFLNLQKLNR